MNETKSNPFIKRKVITPVIPINLKQAIEDFQSRKYEKYCKLLQTHIDTGTLSQEELDRLGDYSLLLGKTPEDVNADINLLNAHNLWYSYHVHVPKYVEQKAKAEKELAKLRERAGEENANTQPKPNEYGYGAKEERVMVKYRPDMNKQKALIAQADEWIKQTNIHRVNYQDVERRLRINASIGFGKPKTEPTIADVSAFLPQQDKGKALPHVITQNAAMTG